MAPGLRVTVRQVGPSTGEGSVRAHTVKIDRPLEKGGSDQGPMGGELMLLGVGGCFLSNLLAAARERGEPVTGVEVEISAGVTGPPTRYTDVEIRVKAESVEPERLARLVLLAERGCIATATLRAGSPITVVQEGASAVRT
jgi:putative redox protein